MRFLFDPDSMIMRIISRLCDLVILNVVFLLTCLPVFTIGAALTALYDVAFRMDTEREGALLRTYFRAFRANFRQATIIWLIVLLIGAASCVNIIKFSEIGGILGFLLFLTAMLVLVNTVFVAEYAFPLLSQFDNPVGATLKNALILGAVKLPRSLLMMLINCFPLVLLFVNLYAFLYLLILWNFLYFSAGAYLNSRILKKVFDPIREQAENLQTNP